MSTFLERVNGIKAQQSAMQMAKQDTAISKASDFWNRVDGIKAMQSSNNGVYPSASDFIRNSGYDPSAVAFAQSPYYPGNSGGFTTPAAVISGGDLTKPKVTAPSGGNSGSGIYSDPVTPNVVNYLNADIAKHYGMSAETAYQETLANTAYQRAVKDMQAAGLNPAVLFGAGRVSPAGGVYNPTVNSVEQVSSGGSGGSRRRSSGSSKNNGKLFTTGEFYGISAAAGLVSAIVSKNPNSYWIGQTVAQGFMTAADSLFRK